MNEQNKPKIVRPSDADAVYAVPGDAPTPRGASAASSSSPDKDKSSKSHTNLTESGYLQNQVNDASAAMGVAFDAIKKDLLGAANPGAITKQYPWAMVGAAAVAGFFAASAVVPSKEEQALKKLERIERALRPYPTPEYPVPPHQTNGSAKQSQSIMGRIFSEVMSALKPALSSALAAYAAAPDPNDNGNGKDNGASTGAAASNAAYFQQEQDPDRPQA